MSTNTYIIGTHRDRAYESALYGAGHTLREAIRDARQNTGSAKKLKEHTNADTESVERWEIYVCDGEILPILDFYGDGFWGNLFDWFDDFYREFKFKNLLPEAPGEPMPTADWFHGFPRGFNAGDFIHYHSGYGPQFWNYWAPEEEPEEEPED